MDGIAIRTSGWILSGLGVGFGALLTVINRTADHPSPDGSYPVLLGSAGVMVLTGLSFVFFGGRRAAREAERDAALLVHRGQDGVGPN
jgi:hypothetical protein